MYQKGSAGLLAILIGALALLGIFSYEINRAVQKPFVGSGGGVVTVAGSVSSVSNVDGTLTISPTTGAVIGSLALGNANTWTGRQTINLASTTSLTVGNVLNVNGAGTSTFTGGSSFGSLSSSNGVAISAGCFSVNGTCLSSGGTPGGSNTQIQYNNNSSFGGSSNFVWDNANIRVGIGTTTPIDGITASSTSAVVTEYPDNPGANVTIDWSKGNHHKTVLNQNTTLTFNGGHLGGTYTLFVCQGGVGSYGITWDGLVQWNGMSGPVLSTAVGVCDIASFYFSEATGTKKYFGSFTAGF